MIRAGFQGHHGITIVRNPAENAGIPASILLLKQIQSGVRNGPGEDLGT